MHRELLGVFVLIGKVLWAVIMKFYRNVVLFVLGGNINMFISVSLPHILRPHLVRRLLIKFT